MSSAVQMFHLVRPALSMDYDAYDKSIANQDPPIGGTYLFGQPDLPSGTPWPTYGTCLTTFQCEIPADDPCRFVGQLNLRDFKGTVAGNGVPAEGIVYFFSHTETEEFGSTAIRVLQVEKCEDLVPTRPPDRVREDNLGERPREPTFKEELTLPERRDSPWESALRLNEFGENGCRLYDRVRNAGCTSQGLGVLGYLYATSGADPSPDCEHFRLASVRVSINAGVAHLAISADNLRAGQLDAVKYVWNDWDS